MKCFLKGDNSDGPTLGGNADLNFLDHSKLDCTKLYRPAQWKRGLSCGWVCCHEATPAPLPLPVTELSVYTLSY